MHSLALRNLELMLELELVLMLMFFYPMPAILLKINLGAKVQILGAKRHELGEFKCVICKCVIANNSSIRHGHMWPYVV